MPAVGGDDVDGLAVFLDGFVLVDAVELHAAGLAAGPRGGDARALAEECVALPAQRAAEEDAVHGR